MKIMRWPLALLVGLWSTLALAQNVSVPAVTTNDSATITTGNTFQVVLAPGVYRSLTIEDNNASDSCWVYVGSGSATKGQSILLLSGGSYARYFPYIPADEIQATCATTGDTLYVDHQ